MSGQMEGKIGTMSANRKLRHVIIPAWLLAIALLAAGCGRSTEPLHQPTPTPTTAPADTAPAQSPAGEPPDQYLKFGRLTTENGLSNDNVWGIAQDSQGFMWFGTDDGLNRYDGSDFKWYRHDPDDPNSLSSNSIRWLFEDHTGVLWVGTMGGLNRFNPEAETFTRYHNIPTDPHSLANDAVFSLYEDLRGRLWIGTYGGGLDKLDRENEQFIHHTVKNGLPSNTVWGILEEDASPDGEGGNLWLSTTWGLSRFNPQTETFRNYDVRDGLQGNTFIAMNNYYKGNSGEMFFGGSNGFTAFYPEQIVDNPQVPPVMITNFQLANKPVPIGADSVLQKPILETDHLVPSYLDREATLEVIERIEERAPETAAGLRALVW